MKPNRICGSVGPGLFARLLLLGAAIHAPLALAHGGVVFEEDVCVLNIGFLQAHFTGYQPESRGSEEFCEDLPDVGSSVFVIDYLHDFLKEMDVDFRIITDSTDLGIYAKWEDIVKLEDIEADTVFYQPPIKWTDGAVNITHEFRESGGYIGIVTAQHPTEDKFYKAVFFFSVGGTGYGYLPLFIGIIVLVQVGYLWSKGSFARVLPGSRAPRV